MKKFLILIIALLLVSEIYALELAGGTSLEKGDDQVQFGGSVVFGILSPEPTFTHSLGLNKARMYSQRLKYAHGFGDVFLKDFYLEIESLTFQSHKEQVNGITVHGSDAGWALTLRSGGNFIHKRKFIFGPWFETTAPIIIDKEKFLNPVLNYVGAGLNAVYSFIPEIGLNQSIFVGSGLFAPNRRNLNLRSATLGIFNVGKPLFNWDMILHTGGVLETDLTTRTDSAYQVSALGDGRIKNFVFITPFLFDLSLGNKWTLSAGHAVKWLGKSVRGSQFSTLSVSKVF